jgi:hypothetical protein
MLNTCEMCFFTNQPFFSTINTTTLFFNALWAWAISAISQRKLLVFGWNFRTSLVMSFMLSLVYCVCQNKSILR